MRNIKLVLAYDGGDFNGWQVQPGLPTIQGSLAEAILRMSGEQVLPQGSGRTDAGVHALGQVASFTTGSPIPVPNILVALNDLLPASIRVLEVQEAPAEFHPRRSARAKTYRYRMYREAICPPFLARYVCHHPYALEEAAMQEAARLVVGEHDFTSFAAVDAERAERMRQAQENADEDAPNNVRRIFSSAFSREAAELIYTVRGNGFLHHMVRNLVGLFLLVGKGTVAADEVRRVLQARDRSANPGATAPASGLYLVSVEYG
ncbi:MAG TPA: tRNA pseudouridine(38-40) synthase TruA [Terriglobales bacterium]|nr:tRNA pseudouridine(38-40) synthase TruA [Terriglobales bacterium]